jgi:hypothetical protein
MVTSPRASANAYPAVPREGLPPKEHLKALSEAVNGILQGKINVTGALTLTANAASTTLTDRRINPDSVIVLMPKTANAAAALATTSIVPGDQTATVTHANNAQTDREFRYAVLG